MHDSVSTLSLLIPEMKGRLLMETDIIFGAVRAEERTADIAKQEHGVARGAVDTSEHSIGGKV